MIKVVTLTTASQKSTVRR